MVNRLVSADENHNVPDNLNIRDVNLPARLQDGALNATYVTFVDSVTGLPLVGKHVIIKVDQTLDDIADIVVEDI